MNTGADSGFRGCAIEPISVVSTEGFNPGEATPGPWTVCRHLESVEADADCSCGYRGVIYGPDHDVAMAICQPGHQPAPKGQEGTEPGRYPREVEIANAHLIAAAPDLLAALERVVRCFDIKDGISLNDEQAVKHAAWAIAKARPNKFTPTRGGLDPATERVSPAIKGAE